MREAELRRLMGEMDGSPGSPLPTPGELGGRPQLEGRQVFLENGEQVVSADALILRDEGALSGPAIEESVIALFMEHDRDNDGYIDDDSIAKLLPQLYLTRGAGPLHRDWKFTLVSLVQSSIKHFQDPKRKGEVRVIIDSSSSPTHGMNPSLTLTLIGGHP